uniref:LysM domain-containing protein n=1 Tax=Rhabditophanes sp. KR3021 TaxID=114890 RepID=A0AC35TRS4_9BILA
MFTNNSSYTRLHNEDGNGFELRRKNSSSSSKVDTNIVFLDKVIHPEDTLNKISLKYHIPAADIKRANNILNDQEIYALKNIKIPVTELKRDFLIKEFGQEFGNIYCNAERPPKQLIHTNDNDRDESVERIFAKTDSAVSHIRETFPAPVIEGDNHHFINASSPDSSTKEIFFVLLVVVLMFMLIPLLLTYIVEEGHIEHQSDILHHHGSHENKYVSN